MLRKWLFAVSLVAVVSAVATLLSDASLRRRAVEAEERARRAESRVRGLEAEIARQLEWREYLESRVANAELAARMDESEPPVGAPSR